jgi:hypothetical protein
MATSKLAQMGLDAHVAQDMPGQIHHTGDDAGRPRPNAQHVDRDAR